MIARGELDYEDIPFVFAAESASTAQPTDEELAVVAATLAELFPAHINRTWATESRIMAVSNRLHNGRS